MSLHPLINLVVQGKKSTNIVRNVTVSASFKKFVLNIRRIGQIRLISLIGQIGRRVVPLSDKGATLYTARLKPVLPALVAQAFLPSVALLAVRKFTEGWAKDGAWPARLTSYALAELRKVKKSVLRLAIQKNLPSFCILQSAPVVSLSITFCIVLFSVLSLTFNHAPTTVIAATNRQIPIVARVINPETRAIVDDGTYTIRFAIYSANRTVSDPYPSNTDAGIRLWSETKDVAIKNGIMSTLLGTVTVLPGTVDFASNDIYIGIQFNTDAEMVPRRQIGSVAHAISADNVGGFTAGSGASNLLQLDSAGNIVIQGSASYGGTLTVAGATTLNGGLTVTGNALFNNNLAVTGTINATGDIYTSGVLHAASLEVPGGVTIGSSGDNITVNSSIIPGVAGLNIGSPTNHFSTGYFDNLNVGATDLNGTSSLAFSIDTNQATNNTDVQNLQFYLGPTLNSYAALQWNGPTNKFNLYSNLGNSTFADLAVGSISTVTNATIGGKLSLTANGAASTPPLEVSGTWFSGGTGTTTTPQFLLQPTGTTSTGWSTAGTGLGVNSAAAFAGNLVDLQVDGVSKAKVDASGNLTISGTFSGSGSGALGYWSRTGTILSPTTANDQLTLLSTTSPQAIIGYDGTNKLTVDTSVTGTTTLTTAGTTPYLALMGGNVGIGTTSPSSGMLQINNATNKAGLYIGTNVARTMPNLRLIGSSSDNLNGGGGLEIGDDNVVYLKMFRQNNNDFQIKTSAAGGGSGHLNIMTAGNVGIGIIAPTAKLDVQGLAANDLPTYSAEFLLATGWTSTDWTGDWATGWSHTAGNTSVLSQSKVAVNATKYQIAYTVTNRTAGSVTVAFGGKSIGGITTTGAFGPTTTSTANLTITPTTGFDGTIVISIKSLTAGSTSLIAMRSSDGTSRLEVRANTATGNTFIGVSAGQYNTTGASNSAVGYQALQNTTTGTGNSALGVGALQANTTGSSNIAMGYQAGRYITDGATSNATSGTSVYLGNGTKALASGDANEIVIGYNATGLGSNTVVLGNSSIITTALQGNVGIGDTSPAAMLTVGNGDLFQVNSSGAIAASTGIASSGAYIQSGVSANTFTGASTFSAAGTALSVTNNATIGGILTVPTINTSASALALQPSTGIVNINTASLQNKVRVFASDGTNYIEMTHDGTNGVISTSTGEIQIGTGTSGDVLIGGVGSASNLVFEESASINGQGANTITLGVSGDTFNLNTTGTTYNIGILNSAGASLNTTSTSTTALTINGPTSLASNLLDLQVNSVSKLSVSSAGVITTTGVVTAGNDTITGNLSVTSANTTQTTTSSALSVAANSLTTGTGLYVTSSSLTSGSLGQLASASTAGTASSSSKMLEIARSGANANTAHTAYGLYSAVTNTNVTSGTNVAAYLSASGATTANYALQIASGQFINQSNGAASSSASVATGTWFSGGSATTTKPHVLIEVTGATSTGWSTAGTGLGVNSAAAFAGNLLDLQVNGVSKAKVDASGNLTISGTFSGSGSGALGYWSRTGTTLSPTTAGDLISTSGGYTQSGVVANTFTGASTFSAAGTALSVTNNATVGGVLTVPTINTSASALALQPSTGIVNINTASIQNYLRVFAADNASYIQLTHDSTNGSVTSSLGELQLNGTGTNQVVIGDVGTAMNLVFEESSTISGQGANTITMGVAGDTFNLNTTGTTYNIGILNSAGASLNTTSTSTTALTINGPTSLASNLFDLQVNSVSKLSVSAAGVITTTGVVTAGNDAITGNLSVTSANTTQTTTSSALSVAANSLTTGTGLYVTSSSLTSGSLGQLASASTAGTASSSSKMLEIARSGANANTAHTAYGLYSAVTNTNVTSGTNVAAYLSASGATTANYALQIADGQLFSQTNSTVSTSAALLNGTWYAAGDATTTKPHLLVETTGATSTGWSASGTGLGVNAASGFAGNLVDFQLNGVSKFKVDKNGNPSVAGTIYTANGIANGTSANAAVQTTANGTVIVRNVADANTALTVNQSNGTSTGLVLDLQFGAVTKFSVSTAGTVATVGGYTQTGVVANTLSGATTFSAAGTALSVTNNATIGGTLTVATITSTGSLAITTASNGNLTVTPNGSGSVKINTSGGGTTQIGDGGTTNYAQIDGTGALTFVGSGRPYSEIVLIPEDAVLPASNGCARNQTDATNHSYFSLDCDAASDEWANWQFKMPQNYVSASNIQVDITWVANATAGSAIFDVGYTAVANAAQWDTATRTDVTGSAVLTGGTAYLINTSTVTLPAPSINASDTVSLRINRDANGGTDDLAVDAKIVSIRLKFLVAN